MVLGGEKLNIVTFCSDKYSICYIVGYDLTRPKSLGIEK